MEYTVIEVLEMDREGNARRKEIPFVNINQAKKYIESRIKEIIKDDTAKFLRTSKRSFKDIDDICQRELKFWLSESDEYNYPYVASYLGWSCFWNIEKAKRLIKVQNLNK